MRWLVAVVALAGCDKVFGLDPITPPDAAIDAPPDTVPMVTGKLFERYATNTATFAPEIDTYYFTPGTIGIAAQLDDGSYPPVQLLADGTFSFPLAHAGQRYHLVTTFNELESTSPQLTLVRMLGGRPDRRPGGAPSYLTFNFPVPMAGQTGAYIVTTGQYSYTPTSLASSPSTFDWELATPYGGVPLGLLDAAKNDVVYVFQYEVDFPSPGGGPPYSSIIAASSTSVTQEFYATAGLNTPTGAARGSCVQFTVHDGAEYTRLAASQLARAYTSYSAWTVYWVPSADQLGLIAAFPLAASGGYMAPVDQKQAPVFAEPFPGGDLVIGDLLIAFFDQVAPGATNPIRLGNITERFLKILSAPPATCTSAPLVETTDDVAIPSTPALDGSMLDTSNQHVAVSAGVVTWSSASPGTVHESAATLFELVAVNSDSTVLARQTITTTDQTVHFDRAKLVSGHTFMIAITTQMSLPNASAGDFSTVAFPIQIAQIWSQPFVVQ